MSAVDDAIAASHVEMHAMSGNAHRIALYEAGKSDKEIGMHEGLSRWAILLWRKRHSLPSIAPRSSPAPASLRSERLELYESGCSDGQIASAVGLTKKQISDWRREKRLPPNQYVHRQLTPEQRAARLLLYNLGFSDWRIAREQRVDRKSIGEWRRRIGLTANGRRGGRNKKEDNTGDWSAKMFGRIKRALPVYLSPADRDDAAGDLFEAVLSGNIPIEEIERRARMFGNAVIADYANRWGNRSLNEELGTDGDGFTMMDMLRDERSSSWLEEMGATAW